MCRDRQGAHHRLGAVGVEVGHAGVGLGEALAPCLWFRVKG